MSMAIIHDVPDRIVCMKPNTMYHAYTPIKIFLKIVRDYGYSTNMNELND